MGLPAGPVKRIGVLGGTFDPVHNGHLALAETVWQTLDLSALLFVPAFLPPHKQAEAISSFAHRAAMLDLAVAGRPGFLISRLEAERRGPSYSIDTLRALSGEFGGQAELFFIIGMDAFAAIATWKDYRSLLDYASFVVVGRPDQSRQSCSRAVTANFPGFVFEATTGRWRDEAGRGGIYPVALPPQSVSATEVREAVRLGLPFRSLVPARVGDYIETNGLYR